jgi:glycosyltransferase involved in cell wall biosynthesis
MPSVSVVVPAYNAEPFLRTAVHSALQQSFGNLEVIVVDDGSSDGTRALAESLAVADPRVRVVTIPNSGVAAARNVGIEEARGEWIAFLDADDVWEPEKLSLQMHHLASHPELCAVSSYGTYIGMQEQVFGVVEIGIHNPGELHRKRVRRKPIWLLTPSVVCRREALRELGGFDSGFGGAGEDLDLWTRLAERYDVQTLPRHLVKVRISGESASMTKFRRIQEHTLWVRLNTQRRGEGVLPLSHTGFLAWLDTVDPRQRRRWERSWRSGFYYRQAGHKFLERRYVAGAIALLRSAFVDPSVPGFRLKRQVWPYIRRAVLSRVHRSGNGGAPTQ